MKELPAENEPALMSQEETLRNLIQTSIDLSSAQDRQAMLDRILTDARRLSGAEAGSLYVRSGEGLEFAVAQNDAIDVSKVAEVLVGRELSLGPDSLAGFVAFTGRSVNVPDSRHLEPGTPFRVRRDFDAASGYRTRSILALPLKCPNGEVVGVLELINRLDPSGHSIPFPDRPEPAVMSLASLAAVSLHNALLAERVKDAHLDTIMRLSVAAEFRDKGTAEHINRISFVSGTLAKSLGLGPELVELIHLASPMHDIGKIAIPDSILLKPGRLTPEERKIIETHAIVGAQILDNPPNELMAMAREIALGHHERWDGEGYPHRLRSTRIPLSARIVCLSDVFDALATERVYKDAFPVAKVIDILRSEDGKQFDPRIVEAFFAIFDTILARYDLTPAVA